MPVQYYSKAYVGQRNEIGTKSATQTAAPAFQNLVGPKVCAEQMDKWRLEAIFNPNQILSLKWMKLWSLAIYLSGI